MVHILILNGPNLNLLGQREPEIYGYETLEDINGELSRNFADHVFRFVQSNHEGLLIDALHEVRTWAHGVVFNPGAYTHYSYALRDAIAAISLPVIEVHLSHTHGREEFRRSSVLAPVCAAQITGFGKQSYGLGVQGLLGMLNKKSEA
jgi:3-dehydroquinate dehydratase II